MRLTAVRISRHDDEPEGGIGQIMYTTGQRMARSVRQVSRRMTARPMSSPQARYKEAAIALSTMKLSVKLPLVWRVAAVGEEAWQARNRRGNTQVRAPRLSRES